MERITFLSSGGSYANSSKRLAGGALATLAVLSACSGQGASNPKPTKTTATTSQFHPAQVGRNDITITVEGQQRTFIVNVPKSYESGHPMPVVMFFHGTNQSAEYSWKASGWKEKGETEGIITVFLTALKYNIPEDGGVVTKWNEGGVASKLKAGTRLYDDVGFVRTALEYLQSGWTVDPDRIFATGFSSGSGFVSNRLLMQMPDTFASFGVTPGTLSSDDATVTPGPLTPQRSLYIVAGTNDGKAFGQPQAKALRANFPKDPAVILADPYIKAIYGRWFPVLGLDPARYSIEQGQPDWQTLTFAKGAAGGTNELRLRFVQNMPHLYPGPADAKDYGFANSDVFWAFFQAHPLGH